MSAAPAYYLRRRLPTADDLPHSDETPVDNQLQDEIPQLLKAILQQIWADRQDWFFAVDMAFYYNPDEPAIVPDAFLALGVDRLRDPDGRLSYLLWQEDGIMPCLVLEVVSKQYNGEYEQKLQDYQNLGILYYVIYNPKGGQGRRFRQRSVLEVYKYQQGSYVLQTHNAIGSPSGSPVWMPEIGLGLGCETGCQGGWERDWLYWYDNAGNRYPTPEERYRQEQQQRLTAEFLAIEEHQQRLAAESQASEERQQRLAAESQASEERQQRLAAESQASEERQQRLAAESQASEERQQRLAAEERLAALEARLKALGE
ncbi:MAG: Uma2 family endonuclease [Prochlorothrix sp.]